VVKWNDYSCVKHTLSDNLLIWIYDKLYVHYTVLWSVDHIMLKNFNNFCSSYNELTEICRNRLVNQIIKKQFFINGILKKNTNFSFNLCNKYMINDQKKKKLK